MAATTRALMQTPALVLFVYLYPNIPKPTNHRKPCFAGKRGFVPDILEIDPKKGFIALPMSVFELELTPGAFRTLAELCRMANAEGQCWPSLRQLGERLSRSRAAVSGYIAELRAAEMIETETQTMANGYNYRLRYRVVFWKEWRKQLGQPAERRVQPAERPLRTKNHTHINQSPADAGFHELVKDWKNAVGRATYPNFDTWPSDDLLSKTADAAALPVGDISTDIIARFTDFLGEKGLSPLDVSAETTRLLRQTFAGGRNPAPFMQALADVWKPHWQKPPTAAQLARILQKLPCDPTPQTEIKLLGTYLKRWDTYARALSLPRSAGKVAA